MFVNVDPAHELFLDKSKVRQGENAGQAAGELSAPALSPLSGALLIKRAARQLEETIIAEGPETVAAFVFEPVQGDGGAVEMHPDFFPLAEQICKKHGVLMIADEVGPTQKFSVEADTC
jgi:4-aminobutyrate aminotransferase-like enzyme